MKHFICTVLGVFFLQYSAHAQNIKNIEAETATESRGDLFAIGRILEYGALPERGPAALPQNFTLPTSLTEQGVSGSFGIDISYHNTSDCDCQIDWARVWRQKAQYAYVRATVGATIVDKKFQQYWAQLKNYHKASRIHRGAYHFFTQTSPAKAQAQNFISALGSDAYGYMRPVMDLEWQFVSGIQNCPKNARHPRNAQRCDAFSRWKPSEILQNVLLWLRSVERRVHMRPMIYTNNYWWKSRISGARQDLLSELHKYPIWMSNYSRAGLASEKPSLPIGFRMKLWQFTERGLFAEPIRVISSTKEKYAKAKHIDLNKFFSGDGTKFGAALLSGPSFTCGKDISRVKSKICGNTKLRGLDSSLDELRLEVRRSGAEIRKLRSTWYQSLKSCREETACLLREYRSNILERL